MRKMLNGALVALVMAAPLTVAAEEIVIGVASVRKGHDNRTETSNASTGIFYAIHEALIERDAFRPGVFIPGLATEWEMIDDDTMELKLREGVTFHNGDTMDAYDVEASLDPIIKLENKRYRNPHGKMFYNFEDVEVGGRHDRSHPYQAPRRADGDASVRAQCRHPLVGPDQ